MFQPRAAPEDSAPKWLQEAAERDAAYRKQAPSWLVDSDDEGERAGTPDWSPASEIPGKPQKSRTGEPWGDTADMWEPPARGRAGGVLDGRRGRNLTVVHVVARFVQQQRLDGSRRTHTHNSLLDGRRESIA